jgi:small subunit ribosomal protein S19e
MERIRNRACVAVFRAASIARKVYLRQGLGVGSLARIYGGNFRKTVCPSHFQKSARGLLRHILKQLEDIGIVSKLER